MLQYRSPKRRVNGVLLLDKPAGFSSNQALQRVKYLFKAAKAGHTGILDPFATGLLPICFGNATKFSHTLLNADKAYRAVLKLGVTTHTGDTEGEITSRQEVRLTIEKMEQAMTSFVGSIQQIPPMYSALKYQGKALYEYARAGVNIDRQPRQVCIHKISLHSLIGDEAIIFVRCSKGTYLRVLAEDIGKKLGCGAHLVALQRLETGGFHFCDAYSLAQLEHMSEAERDQCLLAVDVLLQDLPLVELDKDEAYYFCQGQSVWRSGTGQPPCGLLRVYTLRNVFLGIAENKGDGSIAPKKVLVSD